jgi:hypothetical protein
MSEFYQGRTIRVFAELDLDADCWTPTADVSWEEDGKQNHQRLTGLRGFFKVIDEAQTDAIEMAKAWIDAQVRERYSSLSENSTRPTTRKRRRYSKNQSYSPSLRRSL